MIDPAVARRIRLVAFDVDGTMTDGGLYIGRASGADGAPIELKRFDIQDGFGFVLLKRAGLLLAMVTGRASEASRMRAAELHVDDYVEQGSMKKFPAFDALLGRRGIGWEDAAFVADDLIDVPILRNVGLPVAVANAVPEVKDAAVYTTKAPGGRGAVREFVEAFLRARGCWNDTVKTYLAERGDDGSR